MSPLTITDCSSDCVVRQIFKKSKDFIALTQSWLTLEPIPAESVIAVAEVIEATTTLLVVARTEECAKEEEVTLGVKEQPKFKFIPRLVCSSGSLRPPP